MDESTGRISEEPPEDRQTVFPGYDKEIVDRVWLFAERVDGNDPALWRKDEHGAWINRQDYRNRHSQFGWEIADSTSARRGHGITTLRPLQWQNYLDFRAASSGSEITADGLNNTRRLL